MKKYFLIFAFVALTPSIASAAWWNPLSWGIFSSQSSLPPVPVAQLINVTSTVQNNFSTSTTTIVSASSTIVLGSTTNPFVVIHKNKIKKYIPALITITGSSTQIEIPSVATPPSTSTAPSPCLPNYRYSPNLGCISATLPTSYTSSSNTNSSNQQNEIQAEIMAKNNVSASTTSQFNYVNGVMVPIGENTGTPNYASQDPCDSYQRSATNCPQDYSAPVSNTITSACQTAEQNVEQNSELMNEIQNVGGIQNGPGTLQSQADQASVELSQEEQNACDGPAQNPQPCSVTVDGEFFYDGGNMVNGECIPEDGN